MPEQNDNQVIKGIYENFNIYSENLLQSSDNDFIAHLNTFKDFCDNNSIIKEILDQIKEVPFDGLKYFNQKQSNNYNLENPKNNLEMLKLAYDSLWSNINPLQIHMFSTFSLQSTVNNFNYNLKI